MNWCKPRRSRFWVPPAHRHPCNASYPLATGANNYPERSQLYEPFWGVTRPSISLSRTVSLNHWSRQSLPARNQLYKTHPLGTTYLADPHPYAYGIPKAIPRRALRTTTKQEMAIMHDKGVGTKHGGGRRERERERERARDGHAKAYAACRKDFTQHRPSPRSPVVMLDVHANDFSTLPAITASRLEPMQPIISLNTRNPACVCGIRKSLPTYMGPRDIAPGHVR